MKEIFKKTMGRIAESPKKWFIDRDRKQIDAFAGDRPAVAFPCALIKITAPRIKNLSQGGKTQVCEASVTVRLAFDYSGDTSSINSASRLDKALEFYDDVEEITALLQGFKDNTFSAFEQTSYLEEDRRDGLNVVALTFKTSFARHF